MLLRPFSLALKNNPNLFKKIFLTIFVLLSKFFNSVAKLLRLLSVSSNDKYPARISLKNTIGNIYQNCKFIHVLIYNFHHLF